MKRILVIAAAGLCALAACSQRATEPTGYDLSETQDRIRITPVMTKVTGTDFESGDAIGLTVSRADGKWVDNAKLVFDGTEFAGEPDLLWYPEGSDPAVLVAYHPYAAAVPASFAVQSDQTGGTSSSDLVASVKEDVLPTAGAVTMAFRHKLSMLVINVANNAGYTIGGVKIGGGVLSATLDERFEATVEAGSDAAEVSAYKAGEDTWKVVLPPQTAALTVAVDAAGKVLSQRLAETTLAAGKQYTIDLVVNPDDLRIVLRGAIEDWTDGGAIAPGTTPEEVSFEEHLSEGYFLYDDVRYNVVHLKDGKWWMAQNLAFLPGGLTPATDLGQVEAGVFAPLAVKDGAVVFDGSADNVGANGYLYQSEVALGLEVGGITTAEQAQALEGARGVCPPGWHIPTSGDILGLVGKAVGFTTNEQAPYYNGTNGSVQMLNEDGFGIAAYGAVNIQDNTKTAGTFMGKLSGYDDRLSSGFICGSTYVGATYNTSGEAASGVKNIQFEGLMPMTNKAAEADYTIAGSKLSYRIAAAVRCVRDDQ